MQADRLRELLGDVRFSVRFAAPVAGRTPVVRLAPPADAAVVSLRRPPGHWSHGFPRLDGS